MSNNYPPFGWDGGEVPSTEYPKKKWTRAAIDILIFRYLVETLKVRIFKLALAAWQKGSSEVPPASASRLIGCVSLSRSRRFLMRAPTKVSEQKP
jgi:hypothetical protein